jgi:thiamine phosphate synthase YjbQ (UPF0047 family)
MHITASVFVNDDESGLHHDYEKWLEALAPHAPPAIADPLVGYTTAPARLVPRGKREQRRRAPEAERNSQCCA